MIFLGMVVVKCICSMFLVLVILVVVWLVFSVMILILFCVMLVFSVEVLLVFWCLCIVFRLFIVRVSCFLSSVCWFCVMMMFV